MNIFVIGGAGFIGSHLVVTLLKKDPTYKIVIYDNFSSGKIWHLAEAKDNKNLTIIKGDIKELDKLTDAMKTIDVVYHFASNPDIAKAVTTPDIDFWEGTYLTNNVLEAMRKNNTKTLFYASGSGVYGDLGYIEAHEDYSPKLPTSTYGASKLSCEALICSYCFMFNMNAAAFRFANVVGPHQTHGVCYDFIRRLMKDDKDLSILGDGTQSKSYINVGDVINAMLLIEEKKKKGFSYYNVATLDHITVTEIANIVIEVLGLGTVTYKYTGGDRGWKGDVPVIRLNSDKIRELGWQNKYSTRQAIYKSVESIYEDAKLNKFAWRGVT